MLMSLSILLLLNGCSNRDVNPVPYENQSQSYVQQNEFQRGYEAAIKKEKMKWEERGYQRALAIVKKYGADIRSYEAGKYAIKNKFVTYPKLIALQSNGSIKLKSLGCEIKSNMTVDDIFHYYNKNRDKIPLDEEGFRAKKQERYSFSKPSSNNGMSHSFAPSMIQRTMTLPKEHKVFNKSVVLNNAENKRVMLPLLKTYKSKDAIEKFSLNCQEDRSSYSCEFLSQMEKDLFCKETQICNQ
jgi:hypothetical protein